MEKEFESAQIRSNSLNKVLKFKDLQALQNLSEIKQDLFCPTLGCNAKIIWVNATHPYLKSLHNEDHDPNICSHYRKKGSPYHRSSQRTVPVNLPGTMILARLDRLASDALPSNSSRHRKKSKHSRTQKFSHKTHTDTNKVSTHGQLSNLSNASLTSKIPTRIGRRQINAITNNDIGLSFQIAGQVQRIEQDLSNQVFKIIIKDGKAVLELILDDNYFAKEPSYKNQHVYDCLQKGFSTIQGPLGVGFLALITAVSTNSIVAKLTRANSIKFFLRDTPNHRRHYTPLELATKIKKDDQTN